MATLTTVASHVILTAFSLGDGRHRLVGHCPAGRRRAALADRQRHGQAGPKRRRSRAARTMSATDRDHGLSGLFDRLHGAILPPDDLLHPLPTPLPLLLAPPHLPTPT